MSTNGHAATANEIAWGKRMSAHREDGVSVTRVGESARVGDVSPLRRIEREEIEAIGLAPGATRSSGAGNRARPEEADEFRTCFEKDRDRIAHSNAFRRMSGKTQVFIFPGDHQRTRMTHVLEVAQIARALASALRLNVALTEAIALGHDCGHGPGGHACEDALEPYLPGGFNHATWGADVVARPLNLCAETLDGIRNHSWSRPAPATPEGLVVAWADRIAYATHDFEDAVSARVLQSKDLPESITKILGTSRGQQIDALTNSIIHVTGRTGRIGMDDEVADALSAFRAFNYERIYMRPASVEQNRRAAAVVQALVEYYLARPLAGAPHSEEARWAAVEYVAGMTDRFACRAVVELAGYPENELPHAVFEVFD